MNNLSKLNEIQNRLNAEPLTEQLGPLFLQTLRWGEPRGLEARSIAFGHPIQQTVTAHPIAELFGLPVFRVDWPEDRLPGMTARRAVQRALKPVYAEHLICYVTKDQRQAAFTWARQRVDGRIELRTLPYEVGSPARTTIERLGELAFSFDELVRLDEPDRNRQHGITAVTDKLNRAFDVEAVTQEFFEGYKRVFATLQDRLYQTSRDKVWAHDYALQLLNRIMFLYFIQRKGWLDGNRNFIAGFWRAYRASRQPKDTFFDRWLSVLFFEAFNNKFQAGRSDRRHLPPDVCSALAQAPYLNGGLFARNQLDDAYEPNLPDDFFALLFDQFNGTTPGFLERYNFTIAESTPLDVEVAVDPEMIGKVYESLVNITSEGLTEEDLRGTAGIFYTPRIEIDLMCRLSLVDALANRLGTEHKPLLYDAVFASDPAEKELADRALAEHNIWPSLNECLRRLTICDPACGSGSFLVGMLLVLDDLQARANAQLGVEETAYERRRRIIGEQLYGVDVMDWAVHVAELRLWLQLVVETELNPAELHLRPLLPNLSFKVRQGDSLVQEIGGINFGLHHQHLDIPTHLKGRITQLKGKKLRFYQGEPGLHEADLKQEERNLFRDILDHKRISLQKEIASLTRQIDSLLEQGELNGIGPAAAAKQERLKLEEQWRAQREEHQADLQRIERALDALRSAPVVPFVWDIAFVEIFEGDNAGFDIVIGNPPYVRQEMIAPPLLDPQAFGGENSARWKEQKKAYKEKLQCSVAAAWPKFFRYKPDSPDFRKLDGKSDLYVYFYLHGLSLLNPRGSFCFITSNSWLDVGYGADLQEFLLKHSHVKLILDNEKKRSFAQADVNTIIALLAPPDDCGEIGLDKTARFVMFKVPFEDILRADVFKEIEAAAERRATDQWRICVCPQRQLFEEGCEPLDEDDTGGTPSTASIGGTRSTASPRSTASRSGRGGTRPSRRRPAHPPIAEPFNRAIIVFVTVCTKDRQPLLANPYMHELLLRAWQSASQWVVGRYVIMPDHVHLFCAPATWPPTSLRRWVAYWKSLVARAVRGFGPLGGTPSTASVPEIGGTPSTASLRSTASLSGQGGTRPSIVDALGGTASTPSIRGTRSTASLRSTASRSGRGGTRPSRRRPAHPPIAEPFNRAIIVFVTVCTKDRQPLLANPYMHELLLRAWESASQWVVGRYVIMPDHVHLFCAPATWPPTSLRRWVAYWKSLVARAVRGFGPLGGTPSTASVPEIGGTPSTPSIGGTRSTASLPSTASLSGRGGTRPSIVVNALGGTASTPSLGGTRSTASPRSTASRSGRGGTRPSIVNALGGTPSTASRSGRGGTRPSKAFWQRDFWDTQLRRGQSYSAKWEYVRHNPVRAGLVESPELWPYQGELTVLFWHE